jgi:glutamine synthetase
MDERSKATRAELRCPDPSCNPYLAFAVMLAAGIDGVDRGLPCPPPVNNLNIYEMSEEELNGMGVRQLPGSLAEALDELEGDAVVRAGLGPEALEAFVRAKRTEWDTYRTRVTDWEVGAYLEIA